KRGLRSIFDYARAGERHPALRGGCRAGSRLRNVLRRGARAVTAGLDLYRLAGASYRRDRDIYRTRGHQGGRLGGRHPSNSHVRFARICDLVAASRDPGRLAGRDGRTRRSQRLDFFDSGTEPHASFWENVRKVLGTEYTIWAALFGATFITMATHGT